MSARRTHALASSVTVVATAVLVGLGGSTATAKPPPLDLRTCAEALDRAEAWPSRLSDEVRFRSDGFDSYLGRHPACQPET